MTKNRKKFSVARTAIALALTLLTTVPAVPAAAAGPNASTRTYSDELIPDPNRLLSLPEGFQYAEVVNWNNWVQWGLTRGIDLRIPDMNVYVPIQQQPQANGAVAYLYTNHEVGNKMGGVTRIALDASHKMIGEPEIILKGLSRPCSGNLTPWGTILTGEEADGYVWEIDTVTGATRKITGLGRYNHETGVVDPRTGEVWSTDDSYNPTTGRGNIYKFVPETYGDLSTGTLYALDAANKRWVKIENPEIAPAEAAAKGVVPFYRPEDAEFGKDGWAYVSLTETDKDGIHYGRVIRINPVNLQIQDFVVGTKDGLNMPDNLVFDGRGNLYIQEDSSGLDEIWVAQPNGHIRRFAATVDGPNVGETTGGFFTPDFEALFVNLQGKNNRTLVITGF